MQAVYSFVVALFVSTTLIPPLGRVAYALRLTDKPGARKVHAGLIPRTGGIAIFVGALLPLLLWLPPREDLRAFLIAAGVLFGFGVLDDRFSLDYRVKLLGQLLAALIVTVGGGVVIGNLPFLPPGALPFFIALPLTILVLVGITNGLNLSDGLDGLAGGISLLAIGALMLMAYDAGDKPVVVTAAAILGGTLGFLRYNTFPARVFMGDSGSQLLGFSASVLAVIVTQSSTHAVNSLVPVLLLGLPILDTLTVMIRRIAEGRSPFSADRTHLHHRLLDLGLTQYEAVATIYALQILLVLSAYLLRYSDDAVLAAAYGGFVVAVSIGLPRLAARSAYLEGRAEGASPIGRFIAHARATALLRRYPFLVLNLAVPFVLVTGALVADPPTEDVGALAGLLLAALLLAVRSKAIPFHFLERVTAYVTAVTVALSLERSGAFLATWRPYLHGCFAALAAVTALWVRFSSSQFRATPLDLLVLFVALAVPSLGGPHFRLIGLVALESIILFYAIEVILAERERRWDLLRLGVLAALAILAARGLPL